MNLDHLVTGGTAGNIPVAMGTDTLGSESPFELIELEGTGGIRLVVRGDLDLASADELQARLSALGTTGADVALDLSEITFLDSSGLRVLAKSLQLAASEGWRLTICPNVPQQAMRVIEMTGLRKHFWG